MIEEIVSSEGFFINDKKTKISGTRKRKDVTGLVVSVDKVGVGRQEYRRMRTEIYNMQTKDESKLPQINGWLAYIKSVDIANYHRLIKYIQKLRGKTDNDVVFSEMLCLNEKTNPRKSALKPHFTNQVSNDFIGRL
ncbi:MAG: hypothetical protein V7735_23475 [Photobacterium frigidiphilum]|uniref:hypothetical protein n=1 Tax=Photobacterium frigidiphilum TaxID=264736 RepID=UPI003002E454